MKKLAPALVAALFVIAVGLDLGNIHYMPAAAGTEPSIIGTLIGGSPLIGFVILFYTFGRWHAGFHKRFRARCRETVENVRAGRR
ncbi:MAG: hypothetical protein JWP57_4392 [Spirosoma sp.]|nr:hypothetical protein [Spirosoma sp.]